MSEKVSGGAGELTPRQSRFVDEYLIDLNGKKAAIRAGYAERSAEGTASRLLSNAKVQASLEKRQQERSRRTQVDADYVLHRLTEIDQLDVADILEDDGRAKPISQWPKAWRQSISGLDVQEIMTGDIEAVVRKVKWPDKLKNIELLGKHVSVKAFEDEKEGGADDLAEALTKMADKLPG